VQRVVALLGEQLVGADHHDRVVVLHRDLDVVEVVLGEQARLPQRRLGERLRGGLAVLLHQPLVEAARVDADADRGAVVARGGRDLLHLVVELADVARVDAHGRAARLDRGEHVLGLEVDVGDHRDLRLARDRGQRVGVVLARAGDAHDVAARGGELGDLLEGGVDVGGEGGGHRLHGDRVLRADADRPDVQLPGGTARGQRRGGRCGHTEGNAHDLQYPRIATGGARQG
jgi:hypothetical protein